MKSLSKDKKAKPATQVTVFYGDRNQMSLTLPISLTLDEKVQRIREKFKSATKAEIDGELYTFTKRKYTRVETVQPEVL